MYYFSFELDFSCSDSNPCQTGSETWVLTLFFKTKKNDLSVGSKTILPPPL